jgi:hypothetical protein
MVKPFAWDKVSDTTFVFDMWGVAYRLVASAS